MSTNTPTLVQLQFPPPVTFGLPPKFASWRDDQLDAINRIVESKERFATICAPTGFGKSLMYIAAGIMSGKRTVVLTSTKGLQDQLNSDFGQGGMTNHIRDLRGMSNYTCKEAAKFGIPGHVTVEAGPCHSGAKCDLKSGGCEYYDRYMYARQADLVVMNYAMWMHDTMKGSKNLLSERPVEMLVLDEAHDAPDQLADFIGVDLSREEVVRAKVEWPGSGMDEHQWKNWAEWTVQILRGKWDSLSEMIREEKATFGMMKEAAQYKQVGRKVAKISQMKGEWVIEEQKDYRGQPCVRFDPLWPQHYAESVLFRGVGKVVLVSATVRPKTLQLLGVQQQETTAMAHTPFEGIFTEYHSTFPVERRPIIHVPTVQMNYRTDESQIKWWLERIDSLLDKRMDRKGIIHTVSYKRARMIIQNSRHQSRMRSHDSITRAGAVKSFKESSTSLILVSPSVDTGYDFPYKECEFQIIGKLPFPDNRARVIRRRMETDKEYSNYVTAQTLVQMTGRGMRAEDDKCETLILDNNIQWFMWQNRKHLPKWWLEAYRQQGGNEAMPEPPPKL